MATKLGTTNNFFVAATKIFAAATKRFVDRTKHFVVVTKYFCYPYLNKWLCWCNTTFFPREILRIQVRRREAPRRYFNWRCSLVCFAVLGVGHFHTSRVSWEGVNTTAAAAEAAAAAQEPGLVICCHFPLKPAICDATRRTGDRGQGRAQGPPRDGHSASRML